MVEGPVRDDVDERGVEAELVPQPRRAVLGVDDDGVHALVEPALPRELARARLAREHVVGGQQARVPVRQQAGVERLHRQPLEVHDVGAARQARVAEHAGHVLDQPCGAAGTGAARLQGIEGLDALVPHRCRDLAVGEAARDELDAGARARERGAEGVVVGRRVGGGIDDVNAHRGAQVSTRDGRGHLLRREHRAARAAGAGLDAIARERAAVPFETEVLVLDNASQDGSAGARAHPAVEEVIALERRRGKGENDSALLQRARGRFALLLNEDSELLPGATAALHEALDSRPRAGAAGAALLRPDGTPQPSAWRFPSLRSAALQALFLHRRFVVQSRGDGVREVDWAQSAALLVRSEAAAQIGWFDPAFFVYSDEVDFARRLRDAGWSVLHVPGARAVHHEQLSTGSVPARRIVELARNRDRYMRKHHGPGARSPSAGSPPGPTACARWRRSPSPATTRGYARHAAAALRPGRGEGLRGGRGGVQPDSNT